MLDTRDRLTGWMRRRPAIAVWPPRWRSSPARPGRPLRSRPTTCCSATPASSTAPAARGTAPTSASAATPSRASRRPSTSPRTRTIDVAGQVVAPGFIDIHTHAARGIFQIPTADNYVRQGVTTLIEGPDGSSPVPLGPFLAKLEALQKSVNIGAFIGQGSIRSRVIGEVNRDGDGRRVAEDARARRAGDEGRRVRAEHGALLRAGHVHADRRSRRAREGRRPLRRHPHLAHARRDGARSSTA